MGKRQRKGDKKVVEESQQEHGLKLCDLRQILHGPRPTKSV